VTTAPTTLTMIWGPRVPWMRTVWGPRPTGAAVGTRERGGTATVGDTAPRGTVRPLRGPQWLHLPLVLMLLAEVVEVVEVATQFQWGLGQGLERMQGWMWVTTAPSRPQPHFRVSWLVGAGQGAEELR
jgi:hypothetical protein